MKKFGKFFIYAAILLILAIGGCGFDLPLDADGNAAVDPTLSPPPAGKVWVKIPLPADSARTLNGANNLAYIDYYEVVFLKRNKTNGKIENDYSATGSAKLGETLAVSVYPDVTYEVLLLAGHYKTRTLMASSYGETAIVSGKVNRVDLALTYIKSNPLDDFEFNYSGGMADTKPKVTSAYFELPAKENITITAGSSDHVVGNRFIGTGAGGDLAAVIRVTGIGAGGVITEITVENKGRFASETQTVTWASLTVVSGTPNGGAFTFPSGKLVAQTDNIPDTIPWLSYIKDGTNDLKFNIKTDGLTPLIAAGGPTGDGNTKFALVKADLKLIPFTGTFVTVSDKTADYTPPTPDTTFVVGSVTGVTVTADDITLPYVFANADLPSVGINDSVNAYGLLYYELQYTAFGGNLGSTWKIRNGVTLNELDRGILSSGAGVLVKIGNPGKFTPRVDVQIPVN
jgi:hypothetical protein